MTVEEDILATFSVTTTTCTSTYNGTYQDCLGYRTAVVEVEMVQTRAEHQLVHYGAVAVEQVTLWLEAEGWCCYC